MLIGTVTSLHLTLLFVTNHADMTHTHTDTEIQQTQTHIQRDAHTL